MTNYINQIYYSGWGDDFTSKLKFNEGRYEYLNEKLLMDPMYVFDVDSLYVCLDHIYEELKKDRELVWQLDDMIYCQTAVNRIMWLSDHIRNHWEDEEDPIYKSISE